MKDEIGLAMIRMSENGGKKYIAYHSKEIKYLNSDIKTTIK